MIGAGWKRGLVAMVGLALGLGGLTGLPAAQASREGNGGGGSSGGSGGGGGALYGCDRTFGRQPQGHLSDLTTPPARQEVQSGDTIGVVLVWDRSDWSGPRLHKVLDCVAIDGRLAPPLQDGESPTDNDGRFSRSYTVPDGVPAGAQICDQAMLSGPSPRGEYDRQISNMVCHTVARHAGAAPAPCNDRCGGRGCSDCYEKPPADTGGGGGGCSDCYEKPPSDGGRGCSDCYEKAPSGDNGDGGRSCGDCYRKPPCDNRCGEKPSCEARDGRGDRREACERDGRNRDRGDCGCDGRDRDGSFVDHLLRHIFH